MEIKVTSTEAFEGPAYQYQGEDGYPTSVIVPVVIARANGRLFQLPNGIRKGHDEDGFARVAPRFCLSKAREIASEVKNRGFIEGDHWVELTEDDLRSYLCQSYGGF